MRIAVTGTSGLVGTALVPFLEGRGHEVVRLVRGTPREDREAAWDPQAGISDPARLVGLDAVVHLAGRSLAAGRWNDARKQEIRDSRIEGTRNLCRSLAEMIGPPRVLVTASAVGYYGSRGDEVLTEASGPGEGFLARVCAGWEEATRDASEAGVRVVPLRLGVVLSREGGALARMTPPFRLGLGGRIGSGRQFWPWIAMEDLLEAILLALGEETLAGPVNAVAPHQVRNAEFAATLARVLRRPAVFPMPGFLARAVFGEMADALLMASQRVRPQRLEESGFRFRHPDLEPALHYLLGLPG